MLYRRLLLTLYWLTIYIGTHLPAEQLPSVKPGWDKLIHFVLYTPLAILFAWNCGIPHRKAFWTLFAILSGYGIFDELTQIPVHRSAEVLDWVLDSIGILLGLEIYRRYIGKTEVGG